MAGSPIKHERNRIVRQAIINSLAPNGEDPVKAIEPFIAKLRELALAGDLTAMREMFDRLEGKSVQALAGAAEEEPIRVILEGTIK